MTCLPSPLKAQMCIPRERQLQFSLQTMVTVAAFSLADVVLEKAMHKCILKPLKGHVEAMLKDFHTADGSWKQLKENLQLVRQRNPQELGVFAPTPDLVDLEKIKVKFMTMQKMYSPEKKVMLLLRVCKLIYTVMENNSGEAACLSLTLCPDFQSSPSVPSLPALSFLYQPIEM